MIVVILTALTAVCEAARTDQSCLSPISASTSGAVLAPPHGSNQGLSTGSYRKEVQGMVILTALTAVSEAPMLDQSYQLPISASTAVVQNSQSIQGSSTVSTTIKPEYGQDHFVSFYVQPLGSEEPIHVIEEVEEDEDVIDKTFGGLATRALLAQFPPARYHQSAINHPVPRKNIRRDSRRTTTSKFEQNT